VAAIVALHEISYVKFSGNFTCIPYSRSCSSVNLGVSVYYVCLVLQSADTSPYIHKAEVTLETNFFATRDIFNEFLPLLKEGAR